MYAHHLLHKPLLLHQPDRNKIFTTTQSGPVSVFHCINRKYDYTLLVLQFLIFWPIIELFGIEWLYSIWVSAINLSALPGTITSDKFFQRKSCGTSHPWGISHEKKKRKKEKKHDKKIQSCSSPNMMLADTISMSAKWYNSQVNGEFSQWKWGKSFLFVFPVHPSVTQDFYLLHVIECENILQIPENAGSMRLFMCPVCADHSPMGAFSGVQP